MPTKPASPCLVSGCSLLKPCPRHDTAAGRTRRSDNRASAAARGYGHRWRKSRKMFLRMHPLCCNPHGDHTGRIVAATQVDHITPRREGGRDNWANLQPLCAACHSKKTAQGQ